MTIHLRSVDRCDLEFIRLLRNSCRDSFFNNKPITREQQERWYSHYLKDRNSLFFVIIYNGDRVGVISRKYIRSISESDKIYPIYEIGNLMLMPSYRGQGLMVEAVRQVTAWGPRCFYIAHVKPDNQASIKVFKNSNFWRVPRARR